MRQSDRVVTVAFLLAPGVHLLDLAGPAQTFGALGDVTGDPWRLTYVAEAEEVTSHQGVVLRAGTAWPELGPEDLVVVPGWRASPDPGRPRFDDRTLRRLAGHHEAGGTVMSVCAGAYALAGAGLLDGRRATTHHELQEDLARRYPRVQVVRDVLYVDDGRVHTSAGIASGTDLALHLVAGRYGPRAASRVARAMVLYARRNGSAEQDSVLLRHRDHVDDLVHRAQDVIDERYAEPLPLADLARTVGASERTLTRAFGRATGTTPLRYQQALRRERAEVLLAGGATVEAAARAVGLSDARMLRRMRRGGTVIPTAR